MYHVVPVQRLAAQLDTEELQHSDDELELVDAGAVLVERRQLLAAQPLRQQSGARQLRLAESTLGVHLADESRDCVCAELCGVVRSVAADGESDKSRTGAG